MTRLLVSVRSATEAVSALDGGAALIDVKEPDNGSLGMASGAVIAAVLDAVSDRVPVSAALGEAREVRHLPVSLVARLAFVKFGTANAPLSAWQSTFFRTQRSVTTGFQPVSEPLETYRLKTGTHNSTCRVVVAAYADWKRATAPTPADVCRFACANGAGAFLVDTWAKDGSHLLDWLPPAELEELCNHCRQAGLPVALAGSLGPRQIEAVLPLCPNWIAVRGSVCTDGQRNRPIERERVRALVDAITSRPACPTLRE